EPRPGLAPRLAAEPAQRRIDLGRIERDGEVEGPLARSLLVMDGNARHAVVIAEAGDEAGGLGVEPGERRIARKTGIARHLHQDLVEAERDAPRPLRLALAGDERGRAIEVRGRGGA